MNLKRPVRLQAAILLLVVQVALAGSVAAKYVIDRKTLPRVWARTMPYDPELPLRGRYLALQAVVDGCSLASEQSEPSSSPNRDSRNPEIQAARAWHTALTVRDGKLTALATKARPDETSEVLLSKGEDCHRARVESPLEYFIPEHATTPKLQKGEELWAEITVPPTGPPRPIQLAISGPSGFRLLGLR